MNGVDPLFLAFQAALAGRYSIDRELGRGGMGIVYLAREVHLDRLIAIKLLPPDRAADPTLRERFLREARLAAKLSHPNIIPIHAVEERDDFVYYVMAFVDGQTLTDRVRTRGPLNASDGARLLREVAWALAYAHGQGLVHRDVKPDNILLESSSGRVLVADFGIAGAAGETVANSIVAGTPEFMSPEQVLGKSIDARSDLYALGATAYYAFSGHYLFDGSSATEVMAKQVAEEPVPLASLGTSMPRKLSALVDRCLAKEPGNRPESAQVLAEQLSVALEKRRELPVALRQFVKRQSRLNGGGTIVSIFLLLPAATSISSLFGGLAGWGTFFLGALGGPALYFVTAARRLMMLGFEHGDIVPAYKAELDQAKEELAVAQHPRSEWAERWLPRVSKWSGALAVAQVAVLIPWRTTIPAVLMPFRELAANTFGLTAGASVLSMTILVALRQRYRDVDTEFWAKLWSGRIGKLAFSIARKLLGRGQRQTAVTHRPTELSLGLAAEQLYESLPKETRVALGDLPPLLRRLQTDAQTLRKQYDEVQETLAAVADSTHWEYADLRELRLSIHSRLGEAVAALETIRLNLLRLHAGAMSVDSLTTQLGEAAEVSERVERLLEARDEVERGLRFPRPAAPTPA